MGLLFAKFYIRNDPIPTTVEETDSTFTPPLETYPRAHMKPSWVATTWSRIRLGFTVKEH